MRRLRGTSVRVSLLGKRGSVEDVSGRLGGGSIGVSDPEISDGGTLPDLQYASEARTIVGEALSLAWQGEDYEDALKAASEELQKLYDEQYQ